MRVAAVQFFAAPFDPTRNLDAAERLTRQAVVQGARLVVLPAFFNTGYVYASRWPATAEPGDGPTAQWLTRLSAEFNALVGGTWLVREGARVFNTFWLVEPNGRQHTYRHQHPFLWEQHYFDAGNAPLCVETSLGRIGLLIGWDAAQGGLLEAYRGKVDLALVASAFPRFHRAVLNFPLGRKVYLAQLTPGLLRHREVMDDWYTGGVAECAALIGAPLVHAALSGRFVAELPRPRLSFWLMALSQPRYWPLALQVQRATLRATFSGASAIVDSRGQTLARVEGEEGFACADISPGPLGDRPPLSGVSLLWPHVPRQWLLLNRLLEVGARWRGRP